MIRSNEAVLLLDTSPPTFYKWVKKLGIELVVKIDSSGKASFIREDDLEELAKAMWKTLASKQRSSEPSENPPNVPVEKSAPSIELLKEINELKIEKTTLSSKVEEYSGYVQLYKEQLSSREVKVSELERERTTLYTQIVKTQVSLGTYKVLFYWIIAVVVIFGTLIGTNVLQIG